MNFIYRLAGVAALAALFVYALSCRPSWSPDSKQVSFTYVYDVEEEIFAVAVHNLETGETKRVFTFSEDSKIQYPATFWTEDRLTILATMGKWHVRGKEKKKDGLALLVILDPETGAYDWIRTVELNASAGPFCIPPVIDDAGNIWFSGDKETECALHKIWPEGQEVVRIGTPPGAILAQGGGKIYYIQETEEFRGDPRDRIHLHTDEDMINVAVGVFLPEEEKLEQHTILFNIKKFLPFLAVSPDGKVVSFCTTEADDGKYYLNFYKHRAPSSEWIHNPQLPGKVQEVGGLCFSSNSETVFAVYFPEKTGDAEPVPMLAEIHPAEGVLRTKALPFDPPVGEDLTFALQPARSPDGRWLAISTTLFEKKAPGRLLLVDLESEDLDIRIVRPPVNE